MIHLFKQFHAVVVFTCCLLMSNTRLQAQTTWQYKSSWRKGEPAIGAPYHQSCTRPTLLVDEDFTDGAFDDYNSGPNGANWSIYDIGCDFRAPNFRNFNTAFSRRPALGGAAWSGAIWGKKLNPLAPHTDSNLHEFYVDKHDDVFITRFRAFSDFTHTNERAGVEVANMEYRSILCPPPDFCHDLSFEAKQCFYSRPQDDLQLETNVENLSNRTHLGARRAHYNNLTTKADLNFEYDNLVIWRNQPGLKRCNVEQWGKLNYGDFWLDTHLVSKLEPQHPFAKVSVVQISLFRNDTNFLILRDNILRRDAQIGIMQVHCGITKKADFNLDYRIDEADVAIWKKYLGRHDSATIRRGDANNDGKITGADACAIAAFWSDSTQHPEQVSISASYNPINGNVALTAQNIHYFSIMLPAGYSILLTPALAALPSDTFYMEQNRVTFFRKAGFQLNQYNLGTIAPPNLIPGDIALQLNYLGSCVADGFTIALDSTFIVTGSHIGRTTVFKLLGHEIALPESQQNIHVTVYDFCGRKISDKYLPTTELENFKLPTSAPKALILEIKDPYLGAVYHRKKVVSH